MEQEQVTSQTPTFVHAAQVHRSKVNKLELDELRKWGTLHDKLSQTRKDEAEAHSLINKAVQEGTLSKVQAVIEHAQTKAWAMVQIAECGELIEQIVPPVNLAVVAKQAMDKASKISVQGANKAGSGLGKVAHTGFQAVMSFGKSFVKEVKQPIA
jgi:hypothetical protein